MSRAKTIMFQGTASDVGKSVLATAFCRILRQEGWRTAPYKSQNMALNSYVTEDGKEIGRAQGVQAEACEIAATTDMNPILIKPTADMTAQIVVHGKPHADMSARKYREDYLPLAEEVVHEALERLCQSYEAVVIEGAGSPAEINLKDRDIVNMRVAEWADAPVILIADIDRGGAFASIVGTLELLEPHERIRVKGFLINKFRGDVSLLKPGLDWLEARTGIPVLGVIPFMHGLDIEEEDSVVLERENARGAGNAELDIAIVGFPHLSNFTDFDPLSAEPDTRYRYVRSPSELGQPDAVILPGTKTTIGDLRWLRETGLEEPLRSLAGSGVPLVGICGGFQMLGEQILDPYGAEAGRGESLHGLGFLPLDTVFEREKRTERVSGHISSEHPKWQECKGFPIEGYEIHMGKSMFSDSAQRLFELGNLEDGIINDEGTVWGTYLHGIFHNDAFRRWWLNSLRARKKLPPIERTIEWRERKGKMFDQLAKHVREHTDLQRTLAIAGLTPRY